MDPGGSMLDWKSRSLLPRLLYIVQCRNRYRPTDNGIDWWKSYVQEFFAPNGVVRVSVKDMPVFQQPNHAIPTSLTCTEVPYEALPRLFQFKYENGVQEELLFLGNVIESPLPTGGTSIICYQVRLRVYTFCRATTQGEPVCVGTGGWGGTLGSRRHRPHIVLRLRWCWAPMCVAGVQKCASLFATARRVGKQMHAGMAAFMLC